MITSENFKRPVQAFKRNLKNFEAGDKYMKSIKFVALMIAATLAVSTASAQPSNIRAPPAENSTGLSSIAVDHYFSFQGLAADATSIDNNQGVLLLDGHINFRTTGYSVDVSSSSMEDEVDFLVNISGNEDPDSIAGQAVTREKIIENVQRPPGNYTASVEVVYDGETLLEKSERVEVLEPDTVENMSREELENEVRELREKVGNLHSRIDDLESTLEGQAPPEGPQNVPDTGGESGGRGPPAGLEEQFGNNSGDSGRPEGVPGRNSNRPGFVESLLSGLFG